MRLGNPIDGDLFSAPRVIADITDVEMVPRTNRDIFPIVHPGAANEEFAPAFPCPVERVQIGAAFAVVVAPEDAPVFSGCNKTAAFVKTRDLNHRDYGWCGILSQDGGKENSGQSEAHGSSQFLLLVFSSQLIAVRC